ncbi:unnamed protein product [Auanema sp. JU1783]|nr:unnamed protein product [Auanema sp. JU1783]
MDSKNDWYCNKRGQYRSIAFGTWKAGAARRLNLRTDEVRLRDKTNFSTKNLRLSKLNRESRRMGESSPNLSRLHPTQTQRSLGAMPSSLSISQRLADTLDCYSSSEYVEYVEEQKGTEAACDKQALDTLKAAFRLDHNLNYSLTANRQSRLESSLQRAHHRSQSAGADTHNAIHDCDASTSTMKSSLSRTDHSNNTRFLRATKKFFRKIYNSATLPTNKKQAEACDDRSRSRQDVSNIQNARSVLIYNDEDYCSDVFVSERTPKSSLQETTTDSGLDMDRSSTPDQSLESITLTSNCKQGENWNNLFEQLRREMNDMRVRDAQILADLHRVEWHLQSVKRSRDPSDNLYPVQSFQI